LLEGRPFFQIVRRNEVNRAEAPWIAEMDASSLIRFYQQMIMFSQVVRVYAPCPRHAEVEDHGVPTICVDESIFGTPSERRDAGASEPLSQIRRKCPAKVGSPCLHAADPPPFQHMFEAADGSFDFRQFGHGILQGN
jgi:hypothetical protein